MRNILLRVLRLNPNYFAFLGGVFIATSVNLYTTIFAADMRPLRWDMILLAAFSMLVSSVFWTILAWNLEPIYSLTISQSPNWMDEQKAWKALVEARLKRLAIYLCIALMAAIIGLILLLV